MSDLAISQLVIVTDSTGPKVVARSEEFPFAWEEAARTAAVRFGRRPAGVVCPGAVFAVPVGKTHVAVVQVADQPGFEGDPPLGFRFLILTRRLYEALGDPFAIALKYPADWSKRGTLPALAWPEERLPKRLIDELQTALKAGDMPLLLGGTQALIDGGRLLLVTPTPSNEIAEIWRLLPDRTRFELWPATFAFSNDLGFHAAALPEAPSPWPEGYLTADQARDYPEGRYELALQIAVEAGNQAEVDRLFARRSSKDALRLALSMLGAAMLIAIISRLFL